ncbi:NAD(P)H-dependent glycerol-3-phosphate dehydrogenase [Serratia marcescens]
MNTVNASMTVIGAGSYGTALAITLARNGHSVVLWGHNPAQIQTLQQDRCNQAFLPDVPFPDTLLLEADLARALAASRDVLVVVPSHVFGDVLRQLKPHLRPDARIVWATKGLEAETGRLLQDVAREALGETIPLAVLSGPTFAKELAAGLPTAIALAATDAQFADDLQQLLHCGKSFRVYSNPDFIGVQLGGAVKNVIAIGAGMSDGIGFGANARTALITRGLAEMSRLGSALGADPSTFMGMAGLGDLVLTCTDNQSRNRRFGIMLGQGKGVQEAQDSIGQVVEGYRNTKEVLALAQRHGVEMPITEQIYQVLYCHKDAREAALSLLGRARKDENPARDIKRYAGAAC